MAPLATTPLIAALGILSFELRSELEQEAQWRQLLSLLGSESIADQLVQHRRDRKILDDRSLHEYVPLYFGAHTPMQYVVTRDNIGEQGQIVTFSEVNLERVFSSDDVWFTDGNAASDDTSFYNGLEGISAVHWDLVLDRRPCISDDWKRWKAAEVLVPRQVPPEYIDRYVFLDADTARRFDAMVEQFANSGLLRYTGFEVVHDSSHFYRLEDGEMVAA
jgi:hypothetical protein